MAETRAETDNHRNSGSRRVNIKIWGGVPSFNRNLFRHQVSCLLVCVQEERDGQNGFVGIYNFHIWCFLLRFLAYCLVFTFSAVESESKN